MARRTRQEVQIEEPIEVIEEDSGPGMGVDIGVCALTTLTLCVALVFLLMSLGDNYSYGPFAN